MLARYRPPPRAAVAGDPPVWAVTIGFSDGGGGIVFLAAATGDPLLRAEALP